MSTIKPRIANREQAVDILTRYREAKTERERRKVVNSIKASFPEIAARLTKLINQG